MDLKYITLAPDGENEAFTKGHDIHAVQQRKDRGVKDTTGPALPHNGKLQDKIFSIFPFLTEVNTCQGPVAV